MRPNPKRLASFQSVNHCYLVSPPTHSFVHRQPVFSSLLSTKLPTCSALNFHAACGQSLTRMDVRHSIREDSVQLEGHLSPVPFASGLPNFLHQR